ncbi:MAG TPA: creatininase family protein [Acidimicrobiia bacterium]|jgi:creatinine amidohydrolase
MNRRLAELKLSEIDRISESSILIQPVGAIEQHGPHLPYNTDLVIPTRTAETLVDRFGDALDLWLLPPLAYTKSNEHAWAPGTVWLSATTLLAVLDDIGRSLAQLPAAKLVFLNGHGGNSSLLNVACRDLRLAHGLATFLMHPMLPPDQGGESAPSELGMGVHGGHLETSLMLFLEPGLVSADLPGPIIPSEVAGNDFVRFGGPVSFGWLSDDFTTEGHIGDPSTASAEAGRVTFEATVEYLGRALAEIARY